MNSNCVYPHQREHDDAITGSYAEILAAMQEMDAGKKNAETSERTQPTGCLLE